MEVHEKRELLEVIDLLVKRPVLAKEQDLSRACILFNKRIESSTGGLLMVVPVVKDEVLK